MLTPEQLAHCADDIINLYSQLEEEIVRDIARRIAKSRNNDRHRYMASTAYAGAWYSAL